MTQIIKLTEQQRMEAAAIVAQNDAANSNTADDWMLAASLWRTAGDEEKYNFCLSMAEELSA